jgi:mono/diheme cytochrome c family protein
MRPQDIAEFYPTERASARKGMVVYRKLCAECHGETGRGDGVAARTLRIRPSDFTDRAARDEVPLSWYYRAITKGVVGTAMLGWEAQLTEQQRWDAAFYVWSLAGSDPEVARGRDLYVRECAICHGQGGLGDGPRAAELERPPTPLADPRYLAGRTGKALFEAMSGGLADVNHDWSESLSEADRRAVVEYLWTFLYAR